MIGIIRYRLWHLAVLQSAITLGCMLLSPSAADAGDGAWSRPALTGWARLQVELDNFVHADDPFTEMSVAYLRGDSELELQINPILSLHTYLFLEPVQGTTKDSYFEDHGLYVDELYARLTFGDWRLFAGKFEALFGRVTDHCYGIYCSNYAFAYQIVERVGFGASYDLSRESFGDVTLTASTFFRDTSVFSDSLFVSRGRLSLKDGGVGNTESFESFAVALEGNKVFGFEDVEYQLAYSHQAQGKGPFDVSDENGYLAGLYGNREIGPWTFEWIAEAVYLDGAEGTYDNLWYGTLAAYALWEEKYYIAPSYTARPRDVFGTSSDFDDWLAQLTLGVLLGDNWYSEIGYAYEVDFGKEKHIVGALIAKSFDIGDDFAPQTIPQRRPARLP